MNVATATCEQIVFEGPGQVALRRRELPTPGPGDVVIATEWSLISAGTEMSVLHRRHDTDTTWSGLQSFPYLAGYSNVGIVVAAGPDASAWVGERVGSHGPHASHVVWSASDLRRVPDVVPSRTATLCTLAEVALNAVRRSSATLGSRCAVIGLGLVGQLSARLLAAAGAAEVRVVDPDPRRLALVPSTPPYRAVAELPEDHVDVTVEASGHPAGMVQAGRATRAGGVISVVSSPSGPTTFDFHDACNRKSLAIIGSHYFSHPPAGQRWDARENGELFLDLVARDVAAWDGLVSETVSSAEAPQRYVTFPTDPPVAGVAIRW